MTYDGGAWTRQKVNEFLNSFNHEAAKKWTYAFNYYLDEGDKIDDVAPAIFIVRELVRPQKEHNIKSSTVRGSNKYGWLFDALNARERREEYGDLGDHCLISRQVAEAELLTMGLQIIEAENYLLRSFAEVNGYDPVMLPEDPKWQQRRDNAQARSRR